MGLAHAAVGVRLHDDGAVHPGHHVLILLIGLGVLDDRLPQPVLPTPGRVLGVAPAVEVPGHGDEPGVGRPDHEPVPFFRPVAAQELVGADAASMIEIGDLLSHMPPYVYSTPKCTYIISSFAPFANTDLQLPSLFPACPEARRQNASMRDGQARPLQRQKAPTRQHRSDAYVSSCTVGDGLARPAQRPKARPPIR